MSRYSLGVFAEKTDTNIQSIKIDCGWKIAIIVIALIAITALATAICKSYPRIGLNFDYMGIIVAIFSLLVTILMGWQIWNVVSVNKRIEQIETEWQQMQDSINKKIEERAIDIANKAKGNAVGILFAYLGNRETEKHEYNTALMYYMDSLTALLEGDRGAEEVEDAIDSSLNGSLFILTQAHIALRYNKKHIITYAQTLSKYEDTRAKKIREILIANMS